MSIIEVLSDFNTCTGCNSCINICPKDAIKTEETLLGIRTIIDEKKCVHCNLCRRACQNYAEVELKTLCRSFKGGIMNYKVDYVVHLEVLSLHL